MRIGCVVNPLSGGGAGRRLLRLLEDEGLPCCDPTHMDISAWWQSHASNLQVVLGAGGDGTISWLSHLAARHGFPQAVVPWPLGTGNDCARHLRWRPGPVSCQGVQQFVQQIAQAEAVWVDRWQLRGPHGLQRSISHYCSIGRDARIAHAFHRLRLRRPGLFRAAWSNKGLYAACALMDSSRPLAKRVSIAHWDIAPAIDGVVWSNIPSYAGGNCLDRRIRADDGRLDLHAYAGICGLSLALSTWRTPRLIAKAKGYTFHCHSPLLAQCDGEPLVLAPGTYAIVHDGCLRMLRAGACPCREA
ncbi:MAG: hypothetical protein EA401_10575 [Planctomycetota bacterium]|nr:MAG: hypothetical protein EA401_10575 [Planctomycetota bacterium]